MSSEPQSAKCILVVEDDALVRETLVRLLEFEGYSVCSAANGREAIEYLRDGTPPSLILLDLMMPVMTGWEFRSEQQQDPKLAAIPVIVLSAADNLEQKAAVLGVAGYLEKPVEFGPLLSAIQTYCQGVAEY